MHLQKKLKKKKVSCALVRRTTKKIVKYTVFFPSQIPAGGTWDLVDGFVCKGVSVGPSGRACVLLEDGVAAKELGAGSSWRWPDRLHDGVGKGFSFRRWMLTAPFPADLILLSNLKSKGKASLINCTPELLSDICWGNLLAIKYLCLPWSSSHGKWEPLRFGMGLWLAGCAITYIFCLLQIGLLRAFRNFAKFLFVLFLFFCGCFFLSVRAETSLRSGNCSSLVSYLTPTKAYIYIFFN